MLMIHRKCAEVRAFAIIAKCGKSKTSENIVLSGVRGAIPEIPIILAFVSDFLG